MQHDTEALPAHATEWARHAGEVQLRYFRRAHLHIDTKSNEYDVVTAAYKECEAYLLQQIATHYPGDAVPGEETGEQRGAERDASKISV